MRCPRCGSPDLDPTRHDAAGMTTCRCGLRAYAGYLAEVDALDARRGWLAERITAGDPAPDPRLAAAYGVWAPPRAGAADQQVGQAGHPLPTPAARPVPSAQTLLLGVGALLLVVAGAVFAAVVWTRIGVLGQVGLMLGMTLGAGFLAVRLRHRLAGTAEALAVVAAGLATVDLVAAPLLGLLPESWLSAPTLYPAVAVAGLGLALLGLHARFGLRAWSWLGWLALPVAAGLVVPAVASAGTAPRAAASILVPALTSVGMLASAHRREQDGQRAPMQVAGGIGLTASALATASAATARSSLPGALITTALVTVAFCAWAGVERRAAAGAHPVDAPALGGRRTATSYTGAGLIPLAAASLAGITVGLTLSMPEDPQPVWLAAVAALGGLAVGLVTLLLTEEWTLAVAGATTAWLTWAGLRVTHDPFTAAVDVGPQLSLLAALVAVMALVVAWWLPWAGWVGALLGVVAVALAPWDAPELVESYSLPFAGLLLVAGLLWRRQRPCPSLHWLGPAVGVALIPSALATWSAPWAAGSPYASGGEHLARLSVVLLASVAATVVGARWRLGGLLLPGAAALVIAALAQIYSGLSNLPRFVGLGLAGTLLIVAGARVEALRREGRRAAAWVGDLR